jgi:hypothetical protein
MQSSSPGTSDTTIRLFILSVYLADAATRGISDKVQIIDFDIPGAFLHNKLTRALVTKYKLLILTYLVHFYITN